MQHSHSCDKSCRTVVFSQGGRGGCKVLSTKSERSRQVKQAVYIYHTGNSCVRCHIAKVFECSKVDSKSRKKDE